MEKSRQKAILLIQRIAIGFCALSMLYNLSLAIPKDSKAKTAGSIGALLSGCGLGLAVGGYLSNPYRKRQRN